METNSVFSTFMHISRSDYGFSIIAKFSNGRPISITIQNPHVGNNGYQGGCKDFTGCAIITYHNSSGKSFLSGKDKSSSSTINISVFGNKSGGRCKGTFSGILIEDGAKKRVVKITDGKFDVLIR